MIKFLKSFLAVAFIFIAAQSSAQSFGLRIGTNFSNQLWKDMNVNYSNEGDFKMLPGGNLDFLIELPVYEGFSIEPGLIFNTKGYKIQVSSGDNKYLENNYLVYIDLPINIKYTIEIGKPKLFVLAGPYFAYGVFGKGYTKETVAGIESTSEYDYEWGDKLTDDFKPFDIGISFGGGVQLGSFVIGASYGLGLRNISPVTENESQIRNRFLSISIGANLSL
jgi:hypothetical protein